MKFETRIFKQVSFQSTLFKESDIYIIGFKENQESEKQVKKANIKIILLKCHSSIKLPNSISKILFILSFFFKSLLFCLSKNIQILQIHHILLLPIAILIKPLKKCHIIYDAHELETQKNGYSALARFITTYIEKACMPFVHHTLVVSHNIKKYYKKAYPKKKIELILNCPRQITNKKAYSFRKIFNISKEKNIFLHHGVLGKNRGIELMLETFSEKKDNDILIFMGHGPLIKKIKSYANNNTNILYHPTVAENILIDYLSSADFGFNVLVFEDAAISYQYCLPNKFFEYMTSKTPIISGSGIEVKQLIQKYNIGISFDTNNKECLKKAINSIKKQDINKLQKHIEHFNEKYNWKTQEEKLKKIYSDIAN
tara:strand:- start:6375 stop:7484 length:1110 start_codon:yes stop_codon:yes gene_type:complete